MCCKSALLLGQVGLKTCYNKKINNKHTATYGTKLQNDSTEQGQAWKLVPETKHTFCSNKAAFYALIQQQELAGAELTQVDLNTSTCVSFLQCQQQQNPYNNTHSTEEHVKTERTQLPCRGSYAPCFGGQESEFY